MPSKYFEHRQLLFVATPSMVDLGCLFYSQQTICTLACAENRLSQFVAALELPLSSEDLHGAVRCDGRENKICTDEAKRVRLRLTWWPSRLCFCCYS
jgi:hypothetical protein